jgi:hypothetical protein
VLRVANRSQNMREHSIIEPPLHTLFRQTIHGKFLAVLFRAVGT